MQAKLLVNEILVGNRLQEVFGITKDQLLEVVYEGVGGRNECTSHHPASMPGMRCWAEATRALRDLLVPLGWKVDNTDNIPSVIHPSRSIKIAVTNSDHGTGIELGCPQPLREKGDGVQRAISPDQGILAGVLDSSGMNPIPSGRTRFWYLCIFCGAEMVRAELLCPILGEDGSFKDFYERIALLGPDDYDGGVRIRRDTPDNPNTGTEFDIPVTRKQA